MPIDYDLWQRETDLARDAANKGGPAAAFSFAVTRGEGAFSIARRIDFGLTFIEEPFMAYGCVIDIDDVIDAGFTEPDDPGGPADSGVRRIPQLPTCTGYVTDWDKDEQDNWIGAWVAVQVNYPIEDDPPAEGYGSFPIRHHFTFQAVAIKDLYDGRDGTSAGSGSSEG